MRAGGWKERVSFVLVEPQEAGNIGASARAIKNMGFSRLELVRPKAVLPSVEATALAHSAEDVLEAAEVHEDLASALSDKSIIVGTSRRSGRKRGLTIPLQDGVKRILQRSKKGKVAILFGREDKGLSNAETDECGFLMSIPVSAKCPSINLAQAVMLVAYSLSISEGKPKNTSALLLPLEETRLLLERTAEALKTLGYYGRTEETMLRNIKHFIGRAGLTAWEARMLHGLLSQIGKNCGK